MTWASRSLDGNCWTPLLNADIPRVMNSRVFLCRRTKILEPRAQAQAGPEVTPWEGPGERPLTLLAGSLNRGLSTLLRILGLQVTATKFRLTKAK